VSFFAGKSFLVTGASYGIGREIARALAAAGASVGAMARSADKLGEVAAEAPEGRILPIAADCAAEGECERAVACMIEGFGRLDGLIHSAGITMNGRVAATRLEVFREVMELNYFALIRLIKAGLPAITERRGHIVAISSVAGFFSYPYGSGYGASKHAVQALLDSLRVEVLADGVHVLSVCPGFVRTEIAKNARRADGSRFGTSTEYIDRGLEPGYVADRTLAAIRARKRQIFPAGPIEQTARLLKPVVPGLLDHAAFRFFGKGRG